MGAFTVVRNSEDNPFDRQERIEWWNQQKLRDARVLVVGAGAIGNETLKNLALLGVGNILICDMDTISTSNLSRTVLFRKEDTGKKKAETAALRVREMALEESSCVDYFEGDVVWELGAGVYRYFDVILGCLDNVETRFAVNRSCRLVGKPWIDAGISELSGHIKVFSGESGPCYQCFASEDLLTAARRRYACDDFKRRMFSEQKMPTIQISTAIVSALQVQEAIKIILNKPALTGKKLYFQGTIGVFEMIHLSEDPMCLAHASYGAIEETPLTNEATAREFLAWVSRPEHSGAGSLISLDRQFLKSALCSRCGQTAVYLKPAFRLFQDEVDCPHCGSVIDRDNFMYVDLLSMDSEAALLDMPLEAFGVPRLHILTVIDAAGSARYYELSGDVKNVMPSIVAKRNS